MEQTLVIVLIVAVVAIGTMYLLRKRRPQAAPVTPPARTETPSAPAPVQAVAPQEAHPQADPEPGDIDDADAVLKLRAIDLQGTATTKDEAIREAGRLLVATGAVDDSYVDSMFERERSVSTYMGNLLAIPHGTNEAMAAIRFSALSLVRYPGGLEWNGNPVKFVIGIAGADGQHLELLGRIAEVFLDESKVAVLEQASTPEQVWRTLVTLNG